MMRWFHLALISLLLGSCSLPVPLLEQVKRDGVMVVATRVSPTTYFQEKDGFSGMEYELVELFAAELGVKVRYVLPKSFSETIPVVERGEVHFAAAGLTITPSREERVRFTPAYQEIREQAVYLRGTRRPRDPEDLVGKQIEVLAGSSHEERLEQFKEDLPQLSWDSPQQVTSQELLKRVSTGEIEITLADSNELALARRFYPKLESAFEVGDPQRLAWAFPHAEDSSLFDAARDFMERIQQNGVLDQLLERYYGYTGRLNLVDKLTFERDLENRLPALEPFFKEAAEETGIDWMMLAAIGYQESHWNPKAVSPTGVRGVMMLTQATADQIGIDDRTDPRDSILGGARYLRLIEQKIPDRIAEPDRMWLALAGYNIGFGHLEDARILTQRDGKDPDKWADVKKYLPLLSKKKYYKTVKLGFARGREPVNYVDNIRNYHDLLEWHFGRHKPAEETEPERKLIISAPGAI